MTVAGATEHEIRIALVMNGGVSLAVWMAGVAHELDLIRRATTEGSPPSQEYDEPVARRWRDLLQRPGADPRRLVVDVIAGTSAGGLNGALFANAIAHGATLDPGYDGVQGPWLREQWCRLGTLRYGRLLPDPDADPPQPPTGSILDGNFFYNQAQQLLTELTAAGSTTASRPVTLFTTASGLGPQEFTARDAADQPFSVTDHRFLYRFSNETTHLYDPETLQFRATTDGAGDFADIDRLALAARSSASFPVAFAPRREERLNSRPPRQRPTRVDVSPSWLMDGGVLDNAPFGPVLETVAHAPVGGHVSRYVMYVVPSSGIGKSATALDPSPELPPSWQTTALSAVQLPREVDFRSDVEQLEALRIEADTAWSDSQHAFEAARRDHDERNRLFLAATNVQSVYTRGRAAGGVWEALVVAEAGRLTVLDESASAPADNVADILRTLPRWTPPEGSPVQAFEPHQDGAPQWPWGLGPAERVARTILRSVRLRAAAAVDASELAAGRGLASMERQLEVLTEVRSNLQAVRTAAEDAVACLGRSPQFVGAEPAPVAITATTAPSAVAEAINGVFDRLRVQEALGQQIQVLIDELPDGEQLVRMALAVEIVGRCTSSRAPDQRSAPFKFVRLGPDVALPMLAPADQEIAARLGDRILYGTQVGHFGAFGAEPWRRWDWLMGRLHAVAHMGRLLHENPDESADDWVAATQAAVLRAEGTSETEVRMTLRTLDESFGAGPWTNGLRQMLAAMNDADTELGRPQSTVQIGDRLVRSSGGLPAGLGRWVRAAVARTDPTPDAGDPGQRGTADRLVRWFAAPAREALWTDLAAGRASLDKTKGWPLVALSLALWISAAVVGLAAVVVAAISDWDWAWALAAVGACLLTVGLVAAVGVTLLRRARRRLADGVTRRLGHQDA